ncbi:MAG TPA: hypothetical protein ENH41_02970 [Candidatus Omnitrophica bacterium]|nr:hypothetical protein [Candidatus Omnitrophota bacterium]
MTDKNNSLHIISSLLSLIFLCGCVTIYNPATGKQELILIDTQQEVSLGKTLSRQIEAEKPLSKDKDKITRLKKIGTKIAGASDRTDIEYHFRLIDDEELNAFALPGGFIYVNSGLMNIASDDELACVLAHEVGHIAARHSVKKLQTALGYQIIISLAFKNASAIDTKRALNIIYSVTSLGYSRADERLSDKLSVRYAQRAGFKPQAMISFLKKLKKEQERQGVSYHLAFLSSHPAIDERIKNTEEEIKKLRNDPAIH